MKSSLDYIKLLNPILDIQLKLNDLSQIYKEIPSVLPSGILDTQTESAIIEFQKLFDLPVTGKLDYETLNSIMKEHKLNSHCIKKPSSVSCFPSDVQTYKKGDTAPLISILQIILNNFNKQFKNYPQLEITGVYDEETEKAVMLFQELCNLPVTGELDRRTWNTLNAINETCHLYETNETAN